MRIIKLLMIGLLLGQGVIGVGQIPEGGADMIRNAIDYKSKIGKGTMTVVDVTGQSFVKALKYVTPADVINPWDAQIGFTEQAGLAVNDVVLVAFYARTTASSVETGEGSLTVVIENNSSYEKVIYHNVTIGAEWKQYYAPVKSTVSLASNQINCAFFFGFPSQTVEVGDIRFINYGTSRTLEEMPETEITYFGREADAPWRAEAEERIILYRKGDIELSIVDSFGNPVPGAEVILGMTRQKFAFGSAIVASEYMTNETYRNKIGELFNEVVFENDLKWPTFMNKSTAQKQQMLDVLDDLESKGILMRGHNVQWPSWKFSPSYLANYKTNPEKIRYEVDKHIDNVCSFTKGRVVDWDVINEPYSEHDLIDLLGKEVMADWFKRVRNNDPDVKLYLNDYAILSSNGINYPKQDFYMETARYIDEHGGGVQGIGMQGHFGSTLTPITRLKTVLDKFSVLGKDIKITEFDIDINQEAVQADYTRDFMTMMFSHPSVKGILIWGFWENRHWMPKAAMYRSDWSIKPNGEVFYDLVKNQWWTKDTILIADENGKVLLNGFLGTYAYNVKYDGKENKGKLTVDHSLADGRKNEFMVSVYPGVPAEASILLEGDPVMCDGASALLSVDLPSGFEVSWYKAGEELTENQASITVTEGGKYHAMLSGKGIVLKTDTVELISVNVAVPNIVVQGNLNFCPGSTVTLTTTASETYTYKWYRYGVHTAGSLPSMGVTESGKYKVEVNDRGCKKMSEEITLTKLNVSDPACNTGIEMSEAGISVFPNPFSSKLIIDSRAAVTYPMSAEFYDVHGKLVFKTEILQPGNTEILPGLKAGYFTLILRTKDHVYRTKIVKQ